MDNRTTLLHLSLLSGIGPITVQRIIQSVDPDCPLTDLYAWDTATWIAKGFSDREALCLSQGLCNKDILYQEQELMQRHGITYKTIDDDDYPLLLKHIYAPPVVLYMQGVVHADLLHIALVGSRDANAYGKSVVEKLVPSLTAHHIATVSGGALGIDACVHRTTLAYKGVTVAVLGSGLLKPYPAEHKRLFHDIISHGGVVLSPFPLQMSAQPGNFPARNRIIAGMSKGVVVVQAAQKSGALITANYALEQGRDVFAVPGSIDDVRSYGCHTLIRQGAILVQGVEDILQEYNVSRIDDASERIDISEIVIENKQEADHIVNQIVIRCQHPQTMEDLLLAIPISIEELQEKLFKLQLSGRVRQSSPGLWQRI